jgi:hypothetical protein
LQPEGVIVKRNEGSKETENDKINRAGARRYDEGVRDNAGSGASAEQARAAERALDGPEGDELRRAEREGKRAAKHERR